MFLEQAGYAQQKQDQEVKKKEYLSVSSMIRYGLREEDIFVYLAGGGIYSSMCFRLRDIVSPFSFAFMTKPLRSLVHLFVSQRIGARHGLHRIAATITTTTAEKADRIGGLIPLVLFDGVFGAVFVASAGRRLEGWISMATAA